MNIEICKHGKRMEEGKQCFDCDKEKFWKGDGWKEGDSPKTTNEWEGGVEKRKEEILRNLRQPCSCCGGETEHHWTGKEIDIILAAAKKEAIEEYEKKENPFGEEFLNHIKAQTERKVREEMEEVVAQETLDAAWKVYEAFQKCDGCKLCVRHFNKGLFEYLHQATTTPEEREERKLRRKEYVESLLTPNQEK